MLIRSVPVRRGATSQSWALETLRTRTCARRWLSHASFNVWPPHLAVAYRYSNEEDGALGEGGASTMTGSHGAVPGLTQPSSGGSGDSGTTAGGGAGGGGSGGGPSEPGGSATGIRGAIGNVMAAVGAYTGATSVAVDVAGMEGSQGVPLVVALLLLQKGFHYTSIVLGGYAGACLGCCIAWLGATHSSVCATWQRSTNNSRINWTLCWWVMSRRLAFSASTPPLQGQVPVP